MHLSMECPGLNRCCGLCPSGKRNGRRQKHGDESNFVNANHSCLTFWFDGSKASVFVDGNSDGTRKFCEMPGGVMAWLWQPIQRAPILGHCPASLPGSPPECGRHGSCSW